MPIYEYRCRKCGEFEVTQRISDAPLAKCPTCRSKVTKLISSSAFHLKGSGWYITDYARKDGKGKDSKAKEGGGEATAGGAAAKGEGSEKKGEGSEKKGEGSEKKGARGSKGDGHKGAVAA